MGIYKNRFNDRSGNRDRDKYRSGRRSNDRERGRDFVRRRSSEMHEITCDICKKNDQVPFKPTQGKPILCSECFKKNPKSNKVSMSELTSDRFNIINNKLDKILLFLENLEIEFEDDNFNDDNSDLDEEDIDEDVEEDIDEDEFKD